MFVFLPFFLLGQHPSYPPKKTKKKMKPFECSMRCVVPPHIFFPFTLLLSGEGRPGGRACVSVCCENHFHFRHSLGWLPRAVLALCSVCFSFCVFFLKNARTIKDARWGGCCALLCEHAPRPLIPPSLPLHFWGLMTPRCAFDPAAVAGRARRGRSKPRLPCFESPWPFSISTHRSRRNTRNERAQRPFPRPRHALSLCVTTKSCA